MSIILESGEPREVHHFATLLGYGACAVNPYLAHESIHELIDKKILNKDYYAAVADYDQAVINGIVKIASKMGISTIQSYLGSKIFEAIGINKEVVDRYFTNTVSRIGGIGLKEIGEQVELMHSSGIRSSGTDHQHLTLNSLGLHKDEKRWGGTPLQSENHFIFCSSQPEKATINLFKQYTSLVDGENNHGQLQNPAGFQISEEGNSVWRK